MNESGLDCAEPSGRPSDWLSASVAGAEPLYTSREVGTETSGVEDGPSGVVSPVSSAGFPSDTWGGEAGEVWLML